MRFNIGIDFGTSNSSAVATLSHGQPSIDSPAARAARQLSGDAKGLLSEAALDRQGTVLMIATMGGRSVDANGKSFGERGNARSEAHWREVVEELVNKNLLTQRDRAGEVFSVTDRGYRVAELLIQGI